MKCRKISLYVPAKRPIDDVIAMLKQESSIAQNIKDSETRDQLTKTHNMIIERIRDLDITRSGLVVFADYPHIHMNINPKKDPLR